MKQTKITLELKNGERSQISYVKYDDDIVRIKINTKTLILGSNQLEFYRYLPIEYNFLVDVFAILSKNLPSKLDEFFIRTLAIISGQNDRYDYMSPIRFNIKKDDKIVMGTATFTVLWTPQSANENNASLVLGAECDELTFFFGGDISSTEERKMLDKNEIIY